MAKTQIFLRKDSNISTIIKTSINELIKYQKALALANGVQLTSWEALKAGIVSTTKAMIKWLVTNPLGWATLAVAGLGLVCKGYDDIINRRERLARQKIEDLGEDISKLDSEISSLESLHTKLEEAKGDKSKLAQIQAELNDVIGDTPGLLNAEGKAYDVANAKLKANIELKKQQRKQAQQDKVDANKDLFNNNTLKLKGLFGIDWLNPDETGKAMRKHAKTMTAGGLTSEQYVALTGMNGSQDFSVEQWKEYWNEQVDIAYEVFEDTIDSYDGAGGQEFIKGIISNAVKGGGDLSEISKVVNEVVNNQDMQDAINKYWESLVDPNIDSEKALQSVKKIFDDVIAKNPGLKEFFDTFYNGIISGGKAAVDIGGKVNKMTVSLSELEKVSDNIKPLGTAFKELSDDGYITIKTLKEMKDAADLSSEEWAEYEAKLLKAKVGSSEFNQVMSDLTYKILDNTFAGKDLNDVTEQRIAAVLRENGVTNANAIAKQYKARATIQAKLAEADYAKGVDSVVSALGTEIKTLGLTEQEVIDLASAYAEAQSSMSKIVADGVSSRLGILSDELEGIKSLADAYSKLGKGYDVGTEDNPEGDGIIDYAPGEIGRMDPDTKKKYLADRERILAYGRLQDKINELKDYKIDIPDYSGAAKDSGSDKNEALDNYLKDAENRYKIHQDETKYIQELQYAYDNLTKNEKERLDITGKINEAYRDLADNRIKDIEHQIDLAKEQNEYADVTDYYKQIQKVSHEEANRLRAMGYDNNSNEIQALQKTWWDAQNSMADWRWENSNRWISERNTYNDWNLFDDSELEAWERVVKWLKEEYPNDLEKIKEAEQNLFDARKEEFNKATDFSNTYLESKKTLLQSYYDVTNSIAEAQHEINKELETSKTMYEYLDEDTRKLLFNQDDYNELSEELFDIQYKANKLQRQYEQDLRKSTLETVESITSEYQMQYETLMKSYEIAKADLEIAKKKQKLNNVLNERNVRMFINGSWQWVANTEDVANAKSELADAEYAKRVEEAGLTQQESINNLTKQQDALSEVIKKFEGGIITLDEAVASAKDAIGSLPDAINTLLSNAISGTGSTGGTGSSHIGGGGKLSLSAPSGTYATLPGLGNMPVEIVNGKTVTSGLPIGTVVHTAGGDYKITGGDAGNYTSIKIEKKHAAGTRYTPGGLTLMGEEGFEAYVDANGHLIPIGQPTVGNIPSGGVVFNADQMKSLRMLWDMSNLNFAGSSLTASPQQQQTNTTIDNRIVINGMTVDSGSADGRALINALRRYVGNH